MQDIMDGLNDSTSRNLMEVEKHGERFGREWAEKAPAQQLRRLGWYMGSGRRATFSHPQARFTIHDSPAGKTGEWTTVAADGVDTALRFYCVVDRGFEGDRGRYTGECRLFWAKILGAGPHFDEFFGNIEFIDAFAAAAFKVCKNGHGAHNAN